jgi:hypothetical protein
VAIRTATNGRFSIKKPFKFVLPDEAVTLCDKAAKWSYTISSSTKLLTGGLLVGDCLHPDFVGNRLPVILEQRSLVKELSIIMGNQLVCRFQDTAADVERPCLLDVVLFS